MRQRALQVMWKFLRYAAFVAVVPFVANLVNEPFPAMVFAGFLAVGLFYELAGDLISAPDHRLESLLVAIVVAAVAGVTLGYVPRWFEPTVQLIAPPISDRNNLGATVTLTGLADRVPSGTVPWVYLKTHEKVGYYPHRTNFDSESGRWSVEVPLCGVQGGGTGYSAGVWLADADADSKLRDRGERNPLELAPRYVSLPEGEWPLRRADDKDPCFAK